MRTSLLVFFLTICSLSWAQTPSLQVVEIDPPESATLAAQDYVSVHVAYISPAECVIWIRPYSGGVELKKGFSHPSPTYGSGSGEAFGWFQIDSPNAVDAIHVKMVERKTNRVLAEIDYPISLTFSGASGTSRERAPWSVKMNEAQQEHFHNQARQAAAQTGGAGTAFFGFGFMLVVLGAFAATFLWPAYAIYKWRGWWRVTPVLPLFVMSVVILRILVDTQRDPTSHNLWPFEIIMFGGAALAFMLVLNVVKRFFPEQTNVTS